MALAASFVATHVYYASLEDGEEGVIDQSVAWTIVFSLSSSWLVLFFTFLFLMKPKFIATFFSTQAFHILLKNKFIHGETDEKKMVVHGQNRKQWASIREDVKAYTLENWERWEEEKPAFFTAAFKASVDDDMIPAESLRGMRGEGGGRRRSSLGDLLGTTRVAPVAGEEGAD
jgi:hypothetical protein